MPLGLRVLGYTLRVEGFRVPLGLRVLGYTLQVEGFRVQIVASATLSAFPTQTVTLCSESSSLSLVDGRPGL